MALDVILAPDVYVNASVAGVGLPPERVAQKVLGARRGECKSTPWILKRVAEMLTAHPDFKNDMLRQHIQTIRESVDLIDDPQEQPPDAWEQALTAAAKAAGASRVITDHPDLLAKESSGGVEFLSCEAWLLEEGTPPPPPPS
ncbi:MAG: hypothetical protein ACODAU_13320 [Myxococcota bacterium]